MAALVFAVLFPVRAGAEWQIRPSVGLTFGGGTTFVDLEHAAGKPNLVLGVSGGLVGEVFGIEADLGHAPGFFQSGRDHLVLRSNVTTLTANVIVAMPRRMTEYTLRPYFVGGAGMMHPTINDAVGALQVSENMVAVDMGGGVTGFVTRRLGLNWDVRHFRSVNVDRKLRGLSVANEALSFWRVNMGLAFRF